jgi:hypothetical protein
MSPDPRKRSARRVPFVLASRLLGLWLAVASLSGCVMALSPVDLARVENHPYPGRSKAQVFRATVTALRSLGYELVVSDEGAGLIKTAPKVMTATAHGNAYGAVATENSVAWTIGVQPIAGGVGLHADPRGYSGGQAVPADQINGAFLERLFATLYAEIDTNLPPGR